LFVSTIADQMTAPQDTIRFAPLPDAGPDALEQDVLAQWEAEQLFEAVQAARAGAPPYVFFEGPPTANGRPGIHHVFARTIKDLFCRHRAMQGHFVPRKAGWDTHGLPVEIEVEKELQREAAARQGVDVAEVAKLGGKQLIEQVGVAEFNRRCRESVWKYRGEWEELSKRTAYWLDYGDPYVTYSNNYVESVWWALRTLHDKGLLFRGHKILPYCARCGTALSSHEVAQGYEDVEDPSVYVALDLLDAHGHATPGAAPSHSGVDHHAVDARLQHGAGRASRADVRRIAQEERRRLDDHSRRSACAGRARQRLGGSVGCRRYHRGAELTGLRYRRPLDWVPYPEEGRHEVIVGEEFVSAEDGSAASCTWHRRSARTTMPPGSATTWRSCNR
jgi:isoleucyl-tRNA synthetase